MLLNKIYIDSPNEFISRVRNSNPNEMYCLLPKDYTCLNESKIDKIFENQNNCFVYSDLEIVKDNKSIIQLYPSYNIEHSLGIHCPIYLHTVNQIQIDGNNLPEIMISLSKVMFGIHIPEILFKWHQ